MEPSPAPGHVEAQLAIRAASSPVARANPIGTKRPRPDWPRTYVRTESPYDSSSAQSYMTPLPSEDEWHDCASSSLSDSDTDSSNGCDAYRSYTLPQHHKFQSQRPELLRCSYNSFKAWRANEQSDEPPRKRSRTLNWRPTQKFIEQNEDDSDTELVVISRPQISFHLACPFYISNNKKYRQCLLLYDQSSIEGLIDHIERHHMKPLHCPKCFTICDTIIARDDHILANTCQLRDPIQIDGIDRCQKGRLKRGDKRSLSTAKRWKRIWATIFPLKEPPHSSYLDQGCGLAVSMARDFWALHGPHCVFEFLWSHHIHDETQEDDRMAQDTLCKVALDDLLRSIIENHENA